MKPVPRPNRSTKAFPRPNRPTKAIHFPGGGETSSGFRNHKSRPLTGFPIPAVIIQLASPLCQQRVHRWSGVCIQYMDYLCHTTLFFRNKSLWWSVTVSTYVYTRQVLGPSLKDNPSRKGVRTLDRFGTCTNPFVFVF